MSAKGRPECEYRSAQREGAPQSAKGRVHALRDALRRRWQARAAAAREALYDGERNLRERYFAAACDAADLERRQRGWEREAPHGWS